MCVALGSVPAAADDVDAGVGGRCAGAGGCVSPVDGGLPASAVRSPFLLCSAMYLLGECVMRRWDVYFRLGAFLDPGADNLLVCAMTVCVVSRLAAPILAPRRRAHSRAEDLCPALREWKADRSARESLRFGALG